MSEASGSEAGAPAPRSGARLWKAAVSIALLALLVWTQDLGDVLARMGDADPGWLAVATVVMLVEQSLTAWTWGLLLRARGLGVPMAGVFRVYYVSSFVGTWLPSSSGPDVVRAWYLSRHVDGYESVGSMLVLRFISLLALGGLALLGMGLVPAAVPPTAALLAVGLAGGSAAALLVGLTEAPHRLAARVLAALRLEALARILARLHGALHGYRSTPGALVVALLVSTTVQVLRVATIWAAAAALGSTVPFPQFLVLVPVTTVVTLVPVTVAGFGIREGSFVFFFGRAGMEEATAFGLGLLVFGLTLVLWVIGAVLYWTGGTGAGRGAPLREEGPPPAGLRGS